ncbi:MAG: efflux RND transporter periplasmic adaptor subunit [Halieaceae bacterium]|nr:efflux RND transporter periplasmic adaptor subunit [Halieaceae bacterium]
MRAYLVAIALLFIIFGSVGGYMYMRFSALASADFSPPPVTIAVSQAQAERWTNTLEAVGSIRAVRGVELTSETAGEITEIRFDSGDTVAEGQLLLVLNDEVEQAARQNQIATLELAEILFERDAKLIKQQSIPESQYDRSRADLARARAQLAETEARIRNKRIHAPFAGTVGIRRIELGEYLTPGTTIATLQDRSQLEVDFTLPDRYSPMLKPGLPVELTVSAFPGRRFAATLAAIDSAVDPDTRNLLLRARLLESDGLLPGMFAVLTLNLQRDREVITVPETAVTYSLQGNAVYVIEDTEDGGQTAVSRIVRVGETLNGRTAVLDNIEVGEQVVISGQNKLYRGVRVLIESDGEDGA